MRQGPPAEGTFCNDDPLPAATRIRRSRPTGFNVTRNTRVPLSERGRRRGADMPTAPVVDRDVTRCGRPDSASGDPRGFNNIWPD
jgi:hypothetical protein